MILAQFNIDDISGGVFNGKEDNVYGCIQRIDPSTGILEKVCQGSVTPFFVNIINLLLWGVGVAAVFVLIYGGFVYATAGEDPNKADQAKKIILGAIVGIVIVAAALVIYSTMTGAINNGASAL